MVVPFGSRIMIWFCWKLCEVNVIGKCEKECVFSFQILGLEDRIDDLKIIHVAGTKGKVLLILAIPIAYGGWSDYPSYSNHQFQIEEFFPFAIDLDMVAYIVHDINSRFPYLHTVYFITEYIVSDLDLLEVKTACHLD